MAGNHSSGTREDSTVLFLPKYNYSAQRFVPASKDHKDHLNPLAIIVNDPTAGSPTVTLLRLLVPLNDQV
jgi:hypothetical protein